MTDSNNVSTISTTVTNAAWAQSMFAGLAQFGQSFGRWLGGALSWVAGVFDLYAALDAFRNKEHRQRKTTIITHCLNASLNVLYGVGAVLQFMSKATLNGLSVLIDLVSLVRLSYVTHTNRTAVQRTKDAIRKTRSGFDIAVDSNRTTSASLDSLEKILEFQREERFRSKVETVYAVGSLICSGLLMGGMFFPPLFVPAFFAFLALKTIQFADYRSGLAFSKLVSRIWDGLTGVEKHKDDYLYGTVDDRSPRTSADFSGSAFPTPKSSVSEGIRERATYFTLGAGAPTVPAIRPTTLTAASASASKPETAPRDKDSSQPASPATPLLSSANKANTSDAPTGDPYHTLRDGFWYQQGQIATEIKKHIAAAATRQNQPR